MKTCQKYYGVVNHIHCTLFAVLLAVPCRLEIVVFEPGHPNLKVASYITVHTVRAHRYFMGTCVE